MRMRKFLEQRWYGDAGALHLLAPLEWLFQSLANRRKQALQKRQVMPSLPTIIVGNITLGGTGKTPFIISLVRQLAARGLRPGVISRGYGRRSDKLLLLDASMSAEDVGDEPLLIFGVCACPVVVGSDRVAAAHLLEQQPCDVMIADDGLQHYRLGRDIEIAIVDANRAWGNGHLLPVGPLREPVSRLQTVDWVLINGTLAEHKHRALSGLKHLSNIHIKPKQLVHMLSGQSFALDHLKTFEQYTAIAGIAHHKRFFDTLGAINNNFIPCEFTDHHLFCPADFASHAQRTVVMTAKDAVKCRDFAKDTWWYLEIEMQIAQTVMDDLVRRIRDLPRRQSDV